MVKRSSHCRTGVQQFTVPKLACSAMLVILFVALLTSCAASPSEELPKKTISLTDNVLLGMDVADVQREDTDSDGELEWLVFYRFDQVGEHGPVAALIYDVVRRSPPLLPVVYPYRLRIPDENYLAQSVPEVSLVDIVSEPDSKVRKELVFTTTVEAAFFHLNPDPANQPTDEPPLYRCIGLFRSDGGVDFDSETLEVRVTSRAGHERSQLVTRRYYKPEGDGYFITGTTTLVSPFTSKIDFPEGIPSVILDTPYPEKIVLAFYKTFGKADAKPTILEYLSAQAATEFMEGKLKYGSPFPLGEVKFAVVKELAYYPTQDDSQSAIVTVKVVFHSADKKSPLTEVRWTLIRVENKWKMDYSQS